MLNEDGYECLYLDEMMSTKGTYQDRTWSRKGDLHQIDLKQTSGQTMASIAAISWQNGVDLVQFYEDSVNRVKFAKFIDALREKYPERKIAIFADRLSVHMSKDT